MSDRRQKIQRARWTLGVGAVIAIALLVWQVHRLPAGTWSRWVESVPAGTLLGALAVLPIFGFPISALHIATGARFGLGLGLAAVAGTTIVHLGGACLLSRWMGRPVRRVLAACGWNLRPVKRATAWPFAIWIALLPGVSYALKNLIPPLAGVPWRIYVGATFPIHVVTALVGLAIGHATVRFSWGLAIGVIAYALVLIFLTHYLARLFRASSADQDDAEQIEVTSR